MKKLLLLLFLLLLCRTNAMAQVSEKQLHALAVQCDSFLAAEDYSSLKASAMRALPQAGKDRWDYISLFNFYIGIATPDSDSGIYYLEQSLAAGRKSGVKSRVSEALRQLVERPGTTSFKSRRAEVAAELEAILDTAETGKLQREALSALANYYGTIGLYHKQISYLLRDIEIAKREQAQRQLSETEKINIGVTYISICDLYLYLEQGEKAKQYSLEARPWLEGFKAGVSYYYKTRVDAALNLKQVPEAKLYYDSLTYMSEAYYADGWPNRIAIDLSFAEYYVTLGRNDSANRYATRARSLAPKYADELLLSQINYMAGKVAMAEGNYSAALPMLKAAEPNGAAAGLEVYVSMLQLLAKCEGKLGNWQKAFNYYDKYAPLRDSLYREASQQSLADAEGRFQNKEKQQQIEVKNLELKDQRNQRLWLISGIVLLLAVLGLVAVLYRNKRRNAALIEEKNRTLGSLNLSLEEANETKARLFSIISHDLRSPISQVYQFLKLQQLNPKLIDEAQKAQLGERIQLATGSLLETMEDLLLWSKTQMNHFKAEKQTVDLHPLIDQCIRLQQLNTDAGMLTVINSVSPGIILQTDPYFLQTIVRNLLQNAIKAAPVGSSICIDYSKRLTQTEITITNEGRLFTQQDFESLASASHDAKATDGLGLRLVAELAIKAGMHIRFENGEATTTAVVSLAD